MSSHPSCAVCDSGHMKGLGRAPDGWLWRCRNCRSLWLDTMVDASSPEEYGEAYRQGHNENKTSLLWDIFESVANRVSCLPRTLLDIGCGEGSFLERAQAQGWDVHGIDSDVTAVRLAQRRGVPATHGVLGESLPGLPAISVITLWDVIEHVANLDEALGWLSGALAPGGLVIFLTPRAGCLLDSIAHVERTISFHQSQHVLHLCLNRYHRYRFTEAGMRLLTARHGLVTEDAHGMRVFSLEPERYLSGFAPGMHAWTSFAAANRLLSRAGYAAINLMKVKNKLLVVCRKPVQQGLPCRHERVVSP